MLEEGVIVNPSVGLCLASCKRAAGLTLHAQAALPWLSGVTEHVLLAAFGWSAVRDVLTP